MAKRKSDHVVSQSGANNKKANNNRNSSTTTSSDNTVGRQEALPIREPAHRVQATRACKSKFNKQNQKPEIGSTVPTVQPYLKSRYSAINREKTSRLLSSSSASAKVDKSSSASTSTTTIIWTPTTLTDGDRESATKHANIMKVFRAEKLQYFRSVPPVELNKDCPIKKETVMNRLAELGTTVQKQVTKGVPFGRFQSCIQLVDWYRLDSRLEYTLEAAEDNIKVTAYNTLRALYCALIKVKELCESAEVLSTPSSSSSSSSAASTASPPSSPTDRIFTEMHKLHSSVLKCNEKNGNAIWIANVKQFERKSLLESKQYVLSYLYHMATIALADK